MRPLWPIQSPGSRSRAENYLEHSLTHSSICQVTFYFTGRGWEYRERKTGALFWRNSKAWFTAITFTYWGRPFKLQVSSKFAGQDFIPH